MHVYPLVLCGGCPQGEFLANANATYSRRSEIHLECFYMNFRELSVCVVLDVEILLNLR